MPSRRAAVIAAAAAVTALVMLAALWTGSRIGSEPVPVAIWGGPAVTSGWPSPPATSAPAPATSSPSSPAATPPGTRPPVRPTQAGPPPGGGTGPGGSVKFTGSEAVALTFDDGPDPVNTPRLLDILKQHDVKATFCVVGFRARDHPDLVRRIAAEGHALCNHSWQHLFDLAQRGADYIRADLQRTNDAIHNAVPGVPIRYFRAPGGNFTFPLAAIAHELGMHSIYWDIDTRDWESTKYGTGPAMVNHIIGVVNGQTRKGSIVLAHDNGKPDTIEAFRTLTPQLKGRFNLIVLP
ncbi:polysaccharide deacetylase family protein [Longispora albida]|uniref:polysaccharide deacetylase family protein n=1 Tax=Longispora albida TaxID=203523 RepID=UPI00035E5B33|nr:polysaccharide deacetylase family protein [Longispora albida]